MSPVPGGATLLKKELHIISDIIFDEFDFIDTTKEIHPYVTAIHLRVKAWSAHKLYTLIERLADKGVPPEKIYLNDRVDVAIAAKAGGVLLNYRSLPLDKVRETFPGIRIGKSVHTFDEAQRAEKDGADFVIFGNIFQTDANPSSPAQGLEKLEELCRMLSLPVIATGGITTRNTEGVLPYANGIAVHSAFWQAADRPAIIKEFHDQLKRWEL